jgi:predicted tellurium resistance membrane protein TerC
VLTENLIALVALAAMEIVLGIDNIVFIAILSSRLPQAQQAAARQVGLLLAMGTRIALLFAITWVLGLDKHPLFQLSSLPMPEGLHDWLLDHAREEINRVTWKDLILLAGGLFLIGKATFEIHEKMEASHHGGTKPAMSGFVAVIVQIALLDMVFSIDSVITAVGMVPKADKPEENPYAIYVMVTAIVIAVGVMLIFAGRVSAFIEKHPTLKILALAFLILIGVMLVAESIGTEIEKGYIYFAMGFAIFVEFINLRIRSMRQHAEDRAAKAET